jgi:hypothetical protein
MKTPPKLEGQKLTLVYNKISKYNEMGQDQNKQKYSKRDPLGSF